MRFKTLRAITIWTFSVVAFVLLALFLAQRILGPEVKKLFISEINKSLAAEVQIDDVQLSLFKDFPFASVLFTGVRMKEALKTPSKNYILTAGTISLRFNIWDLLRKKYSIKNIRLADVDLAPHVFTDGSDNFHFWKQSNSTVNTDFAFELQRIIIRNLHLHYVNDTTHALLDIHLPTFVAKGNFGSSRYALDLAGNIQVHSFKSQETNYISEHEFKLWLSLDADNSTGLYRVQKGTVETGKLKLTASGSLLYSQKQSQIDLEVAATGSTLEEMLSLVPARFTRSIDGYKFRGKGSLDSKISGIFSGNHTPALHMRLELQNADIAERKSGISLQNVSALAVYDVKQDGQNESLSISNLKAKLGDGFVSGSFVMKGFASPVIQCNLNADLNLAKLQQFLKYEQFTSMSGWLKLNASFDGKIADIRHPVSADFLGSNFTGSGSILKADLVLKKYGLPLKNIQSSFLFNGNDLELKQLSFLAGRSDFDLSGKLDNLMSWIFAKNESLSVTGSLASKHFEWDELSGAQQGSSGEYQFRLPADISINKLQIRTGNFSFGTFSATNLTATAQIREKVLSVTDANMLTCQGKVTGQANINARAEKDILLQTKLRLENVNVKTLFAEFGNFGQNDLRDQNLEGQISSDVIFACTMKKNLDIDLNSIKAHADILIENGRLVSFSPMQSLSKFLKLEDLADIRFATLHNQVDIANQVIYIPSMEIKSSALNLQLMGTHTFGNELNYHFTLALADLVASRFKLRNKGYDNQAEFGPVEDDGRGRTKIFVSLTGTVDNPIVKYDKKAMREKISGDLKTQKAELKQVLKQELKWFQGDTLKKAHQLKE
ncbi:MAG: AsmA-like C-terminal region-containing protein, partial [Bacteroidota bacterium]